MGAETLGDRLRKAMEMQGISGRELARALGIHFGIVESYLSGERIPRADTLIHIASSLNVSVDYLLGYKPAAAKRDYRQLQTLIRKARPSLTQAQKEELKNLLREEEES